MTRYGRLFRLLPPAFLLLLLACSQRGSAQVQESGNIVGQVRIVRGDFPPERVRISLATRGILVNEVWTDNEGKFGFYNLSPNIYHVSISDEKYEPYSEIVKVNPLLIRSYVVNIQLYPRPPARADTAQPPVAGGNPHLVDVANFEKQFPKKAVEKFEQGVQRQGEGKTEEAIKRFREALQIAPDFYAARNNLGSIHLGRRDFAAAQVEFEAVLKLNQSDSQAYFNLGNVFLLTQRYPEAEQILEEGLRRQPNAALGHLFLGAVLGRMHRWPEAERELDKAQELDSTLSQVPLEFVNLYLSQHRVPEAMAQLKLFLERFPGDPLAPKVREVLARLEGSPRPAPQSR